MVLVRKLHLKWQFMVLAIVLPTAATVIRSLFLGGLEMRAPFLIFFPAVVVPALLGGLVPGLTATIFSAFFAHYFWLERIGIRIYHPADVMGMHVFGVCSVLISALSEVMHRARARACGAEAKAKVAEELRKANDELESRVYERTAELVESKETLKKLALDVVNAEDNERKRIAQEIHDGLSSQLAAIKFFVERNFCLNGHLAAEREKEAGHIIEMIQHAIEETRRIMANLRPAILDDLGLLPAINSCCREFQKLNPGICSNIKIEIDEEQIPDKIKIVIFRLLQESLNNALKYSEADRVEISLKSDESTITFIVSDNGQGFSCKEALSGEELGHGLGLKGILERVELSGGRGEIKSAPGKGVAVRAEWKINTF